MIIENFTQADIDKFVASFTVSDNCWEWKKRRDSKGYGNFRGPNGRQFIASRVAYELYNGELIKGLCICHTCDNPPCVNPAHLIQESSSFNTTDAFIKQRLIPPDLRGNNNPNRKLNSEQVLQIYNSDEHLMTLAAKYQVVPTVIIGIWTGYSWKSVTGGNRKPGYVPSRGKQTCR